MGGGITGLSAAFRLTEIEPAADIVVLESSQRFGGRIATEHRDGFLLEWGPDLFLGSKPGAFELCERLSIADRLITPMPGARAFVLRRGRLHRLPEGLSGLVPARVGPLFRSPLLSFRGKLRAAIEPFVSARPDDADESVASFVTRRFGREMYDRLAEPLLTGIYAGDGRVLSILATFPQLRESERRHGSVIRAARASSGTTRRGFLTLPGGLGELVDSLVARLGERGVALRTGVPVRSLERDDAGWLVRCDAGDPIHAASVVLALPALPAARLLDPIARDAADALRAIPLGSITTVWLAFEETTLRRRLVGTGYVVPRVEGRRAIACTWASSKFAGRAPAGFALLRVFLRDGSPTTSDDPLALARDELRETLGITAEPVLVRVDRQVDAMPQYTLDHIDRVRRVEHAVAALPGLAIAGNALRGVGIPDCVRAGEAAAERIGAGRLPFEPTP